jgi:cytochrome c556
MKDADRALEALAAIERGQHPLDGEHVRWLNAFMTIEWAMNGPDGPRLTPAGVRALQEMLQEMKEERSA